MSGQRGESDGADRVRPERTHERSAQLPVQATLASLLEQSGSADAFLHDLLSFLNGITHARTTPPLAGALIRDLGRAATAKNVASIFHDARSMLQVLTTLGHMAQSDAMAILEDKAGKADKRHDGGDGRRRFEAHLSSLLESLEDIASATQTLARLIDDGFLLYRTHTGSDGPVKLGQAVDTALRIFKKAGRRWDVRKDEIPDVTVAVGAAELVRVLLNLLNNGAEAIEHSSDGQLVVSGWATSTHAFVRVADNGPGIEGSDREEIFDLFFSTKIDGGGMGLHASRMLVDGWNGRIEVESEVDTGTRFTISIPRTR